MNIDVSACIAELLYEHKSVIIPDFGGIVGIYEAAQIDHVQGMMHPPSLALRFNENLVINDGVLISYIRKKFNLNLEDAQFVVKNYVEQLNRKLSRKEILVFAGVGRLYRDFENHLRFIQDGTNYNTDAFGLPEIQFFPILRNRETAPREAPAPIATSQMAVVSRRPEWLRNLARQELVPMVAGMMLLIIALSILFGSGNSTDDYSPKARPVAERINKKPVQRSAILDYVTAADEEKPVAKKKAVAPKEEEAIDEEYETAIDTEASTLAPQEKVCLVITGAFGQKESVTKRLNQIIKLGFAPYQDKKGKLTRVGIQFAYESETDIKEKMKILQRKIEPRSYILKK